MKPVRTHLPGEPSDPVPPDKLVELAEAIREPLVRWALYVTVPSDATIPIPSVERQAGEYPVVYEGESDEPPRAGPAYPAARRGPTRRKGRRQMVERWRSKGESFLLLWNRSCRPLPRLRTW